MRQNQFYITNIKSLGSMRKESVCNSENTVNQATVNFVKSLCMRITDALEEIDEVCTEELDPKPEPSQLGYFEGIGLFSYVKSNEEEMKEKYPAFTENQIVSILLTKWQRLTNQEKLQFCSKLNLNSLAKSKKMKKLNKKAQKLSLELEDSESKPFKLLQEHTEVQKQNPPSGSLETQSQHDKFFDQHSGSKKKPRTQDSEQDQKPMVMDSISFAQHTTSVKIPIQQVSAEEAVSGNSLVVESKPISDPQINESIVPEPLVNQPENIIGSHQSLEQGEPQRSAKLQPSQLIQSSLNEEESLSFGKNVHQTAKKDQEGAAHHEVIHSSLQKIEFVEETPIFPSSQEQHPFADHRPDSQI